MNELPKEVVSFPSVEVSEYGIEWMCLTLGGGLD